MRHTYIREKEEREAERLEEQDAKKADMKNRFLWGIDTTMRKLERQINPENNTEHIDTQYS